MSLNSQRGDPNASHRLCVLQGFGCGFVHVKSQSFPLRYKNGRIYFISFNHLVVLMLVTEIANISISGDQLYRSLILFFRHCLA